MSGNLEPDYDARDFNVERVTPTDREASDRVREALIGVLRVGSGNIPDYEDLGDALGLDDPSPSRIADALLRAERGADTARVVMCGRCLKTFGPAPLADGDGIHTCTPRNPLYIAEASRD